MTTMNVKNTLVALAKKTGASGLQVIYHNGKYFYFSGIAYYDANESGIKTYQSVKNR